MGHSVAKQVQAPEARIHISENRASEFENVNFEPFDGQIVEHAGQKVLWGRPLVECSVDQIHTEGANGLLLELCSGIPEIDVEKNLIGRAFGFGLEANTEPAVLLVGSLVIPGGDRVRKSKKSGLGT